MALQEAAAVSLPMPEGFIAPANFPALRVLFPLSRRYAARVQRSRQPIVITANDPVLEAHKHKYKIPNCTTHVLVVPHAWYTVIVCQAGNVDPCCYCKMPSKEGYVELERLWPINQSTTDVVGDSNLSLFVFLKHTNKYLYHKQWETRYSFELTLQLLLCGFQLNTSRQVHLDLSNNEVPPTYIFMITLELIVLSTLPYPTRGLYKTE